MRRLSVAPFVLAACLISTVALAAMDRATATFESLSSSGTHGDATLRAVPTGGTFIHAQLQGLQPGVEYVVALFPDNQTCASGSVSQQVVRVTANPAGIAIFNQKVTNAINQIGSLSVQQASDLTVLACAAVVAQ